MNSYVWIALLSAVFMLIVTIPLTHVVPADGCEAALVPSGSDVGVFGRRK